MLGIGTTEEVRDVDLDKGRCWMEMNRPAAEALADPVGVLELLLS